MQWPLPIECDWNTMNGLIALFIIEVQEKMRKSDDSEPHDNGNPAQVNP